MSFNTVQVEQSPKYSKDTKKDGLKGRTQRKGVSRYQDAPEYTKKGGIKCSIS